MAPPSARSAPFAAPPPDGIYIFLDDAAWREGTNEGEEPPPVSGRPYPLSDGDDGAEELVVMDAKSVVGRRRTVRVGDHWNVWVKGTIHEVEITGFARYEKVVQGVRAFDEAFAIARMPPALRKFVGDCWQWPHGENTSEYLAAPIIPLAPRARTAGAAPTFDEKAWLRSFQSNLDEEHRARMDRARIERYGLSCWGWCCDILRVCDGRIVVDSYELWRAAAEEPPPPDDAGACPRSVA